MIKLKYKKVDDNYIVIDAEGNGKAVIPSTYRGKQVTEIGDYAFYLCTGLTSVVIPSSVTSIGWAAFRLCTGLTSIIIPNSVTSIGGWAFEGCTGLTSVTLPDSVDTIGIEAFRGCVNLSSKLGLYKAFNAVIDDVLLCRDMIYYIGEWNECEGELCMCRNGLHFCKNLYEIFDYYFGKLYTDIVICECEVDGEILSSNTSKCCARRLKPVRKLTRQEIMEILNNKS